MKRFVLLASGLAVVLVGAALRLGRPGGPDAITPSTAAPTSPARAHTREPEPRPRLDAGRSAREASEALPEQVAAAVRETGRRLAERDRGWAPQPGTPPEVADTVRRLLGDPIPTPPPEFVGTAFQWRMSHPVASEDLSALIQAVPFLSPSDARRVLECAYLEPRASTALALLQLDVRRIRPNVLPRLLADALMRCIVASGLRPHEFTQGPTFEAMLDAYVLAESANTEHLRSRNDPGVWRGVSRRVTALRRDLRMREELQARLSPLESAAVAVTQSLNAAGETTEQGLGALEVLQEIATPAAVSVVLDVLYARGAHLCDATKEVDPNGYAQRRFQSLVGVVAVRGSAAQRDALAMHILQLYRTGAERSKAKCLAWLCAWARGRTLGQPAQQEVEAVLMPLGWTPR